MWQEWTNDVYLRFYQATQKQSAGEKVNNAGYRILRRVDFSDKTVLEIGPGKLSHIPFWKNKPKEYVIADIMPKMLALSAKELQNVQVAHREVLLARQSSPKLPFGNDEFDLVLSFYSFEHMYPFADHLLELVRCLKPGGSIVGAIPAEGGLAWGLGRFLTTRRWLHKHSKIDPDKVICWEHPTFAEEILSVLEENLIRTKREFYPWHIPCIDANLVIRFVYRKPG